MRPSFWQPVPSSLDDWVGPLCTPLLVYVAVRLWKRFVSLTWVPISTWHVSVLLFCTTVAAAATGLVSVFDWNVGVRLEPSPYSAFYLLSDLGLLVLAGLFLATGRSLGACVCV